MGQMGWQRILLNIHMSPYFRDDRYWEWQILPYNVKLKSKQIITTNVTLRYYSILTCKFFIHPYFPQVGMTVMTAILPYTINQSKTKPNNSNTWHTKRDDSILNGDFLFIPILPKVGMNMYCKPNHHNKCHPKINNCILTCKISINAYHVWFFCVH